MRCAWAPRPSPPGTTRACAQRAPGRFELLKGLDPLKDQSYFLHRLNQAQLARTLFPVGELPKTEVRRIAAEIGLPNAQKKDSTGICFIGERPFREFLNRWLNHEPGPIRDERGRTVGRHVGLSFYTLGQRQGLGIGGVKERGAARGGAEHAPWYVAGKDLAAQRAAGGAGPRPPRAAVARAVGRRLQLGRRPRAGAGALRRQVALPPGRCRLHAGRCRPKAASGWTSTRRNGPSRRASRRCSTTARSAWAAA